MHKFCPGNNVHQFIEKMTAVLTTKGAKMIVFMPAPNQMSCDLNCCSILKRIREAFVSRLQDLIKVFLCLPPGCKQISQIFRGVPIVIIESTSPGTAGSAHTTSPGSGRADVRPTRAIALAVHLGRGRVRFGCTACNRPARNSTTALATARATLRDSSCTASSRSSAS